MGLLKEGEQRLANFEFTLADVSWTQIEGLLKSLRRPEYARKEQLRNRLIARLTDSETQRIDFRDILPSEIIVHICSFLSLQSIALSKTSTAFYWI